MTTASFSGGIMLYRVTVSWLVGLYLLMGVHSPVQAGGTSTGQTPLNDLGAGVYLGTYQGGLYPGGASAPPAAHAAAAMSMANQVVSRDGTGAADANGWIVLLSIGMSNTCHEFAVFERQEDANTNRNARLIIVNGAVGGQSAQVIVDPNATYWSTVNARLAAMNLTPAQVQVVWLKEANQSPPNDFPGHANQLKNDLQTVVQNLHDKFPNLKLCYLSSRVYGGYAGAWEPQSYETGFSVKWLIEEQINGTNPGLNYGGQAGTVEAPLLLWGPYLWADGVIPRSDGLTWQPGDLEGDGVHPAPSGEQKVADLLSNFFANEVTAQPWYAAQPGVSLVSNDAEADAYVQTAAPNSNFGTGTTLVSQGGASPQTIFLRFNASGVTDPILLAKVGARVTTSSVGGGNLSLVSNTSWGETTITANNAPATDGGLVKSIPQSTRDGTVAADATAVLNADADGIISLALASPVAGVTTYQSREAGQPPMLTLVVATSGPVPAISVFGLAVTVVAMVLVGASVAKRAVRRA